MDTISDNNRVKYIEKANSIVEVAVELGIKVRGSMGQCFRAEEHADNSGEFTLFFNLAKNSFFCKSCANVGGSVIDLVCQRQNWDRQTAINWLSHRIEFDLQTRKMYYLKERKK